jgi:hypothetical protein
VLGGAFIILGEIHQKYQKIKFSSSNSIIPGAHNDNEEEEGKGRSAKRPRE